METGLNLLWLSQKESAKNEKTGLEGFSEQTTALCSRDLCLWQEKNPSKACKGSLHLTYTTATEYDVTLNVHLLFLLGHTKAALRPKCCPISTHRPPLFP